jgi:single-stranded-DNA-specific exonuclease
MKYKLINPPNNKYTAKGQILINRGMKEEDLIHYMNLTDDDINDPDTFGHELLVGASSTIFQIIKNEDDICVIVDCDCDGYTSSAILINYLYNIAPEYTENHVHWFMHDSKQHGFADAMDWIENMNPNLVIVPDAGSNDKEQMQKLYDDGRKIIILDHHEIEGEPFENCYLINSQSPEYPNKSLSGAGVVYQFCRHLDRVNETNYANQYLDLCALGLIGDMMSLQSFETRRLIDKGIRPSAICNPFIYSMWQKNKFKLGEVPTAWGFTFYIVPFVNAITRSGTIEEKELVFESMLFHKANQEILSNKRGHKAGEKEKLVDQAIRTCTNVKNRQTKAETQGLELIETLIEKNNMMQHKVLLFLLEPGTIKPEIRG